MALRRTLSWGEGWGGDGRSGTVTLELKSFYGRSDRRARGDRRGLGGCMRRSPCMCTSPPPVVKTSAEQGGKGGSGAPMELKAWLEQQSLDAEMEAFHAWAGRVCGVCFKAIKDRLAAQEQLALGFWWDSRTLTRRLDEGKLLSYIPALPSP